MLPCYLLLKLVAVCMGLTSGKEYFPSTVMQNAGLFYKNMTQV